MLALENRMLFAAGLMLIPLAGGCSSQFAGEWVQESVKLRDGTLEPLGDARRLAFQFIPPSTIRVGIYSVASRVVEESTVSSMDYQTIQNRTVAEFGPYVARVEDGQLIAYISGEEKGRFRKLSGESVFPPMVKLPQLVRETVPPGGEIVSSVSPVELVITAAEPPDPVLVVAEGAE